MDEALQCLKRDYLQNGDPASAIRFANAVIRNGGEEPPRRQQVYMTIPTIGTELTLAADWQFELFAESRNSKFWAKILPELPYRSYQASYFSRDAMRSATVTLPAGSILRVARIYIRQGVDSYDSLTFSLKKHPTNSKIKGRFWVRLEDVNQMLVNWEIGTLKGVE